MKTIFLDTSAAIALQFHAWQLRDKIQQQLDSYEWKVTSSVVKKEYVFRVLWEMDYLLRKLNEYNSIQDTVRHVHDAIGNQNRKCRICTQILDTIDEDDTDGDKAERARLFFKDMLHNGIKYFESEYDDILDGSKCACSCATITSRGKYFEFSEKKCSKVPEGKCGIRKFLLDSKKRLAEIRSKISKVKGENDTNEIRAIAAFIDEFINFNKNVTTKDPCSKVGDLLIALESASIDSFMTLNRKESMTLCAVLKQLLILVPSFHQNEIVEHDFR